MSPIYHLVAELCLLQTVISVEVYTPTPSKLQERTAYLGMA